MWKWCLGGCVSLVACSGETASAPQPTAAPCPPSEGARAPGLSDDQTVATWNGGEVTYGELRRKIDGELRAMDVQHEINRYDLQAQALDNLIIEALLTDEAKRLGLTDAETLLTREVTDKLAKPTEEEIAAFYPTVARQLGGATLEEARPLLEQELLRRKQQDAVGTYIEDLRKRAGVSADLPYPDLPRIDMPVLDHDPSIGPKDARVTIVQFAEYQCYYCNRVNPTLDRLREAYPNDLRIVFKDFPLGMHSRARPAAVAAHCAGEQSKYWEMNRVLLENQDALSDADFMRHAQSLGLDASAFGTCLTSGRHDTGIDADIDAGQKSGVSATPAFYINGVFLAGAQPIERFEAIIDRELKNPEAAAPSP